MRRLPPGARPTILALAVLACLGAARAEPTLDASVGIGLGAASGDEEDRALFGQYNGLRTQRAKVLLGAQYERRDNEAGKLVRFGAVDLGGRTRELDLLWQRGGDWKLRAGYGETVRYEPYTLNTGLVGIGSATPQAVVLPTVGAGADTELRIKRSAIGLGLVKPLGSRLQVEVGLQSENREGARLFGRGMACPSPVAPGCGVTTGAQVGWGVLLLPEPIDSNHSQVDVRLTYGAGPLTLSAGYHGSFFDNDLGSLTPGVPGSLYNATGGLLPLSEGLQAILSQPIALAPDNQSHQVDVAGTWRFTPTTQVNFKLARTRASQDQDFAAAGLADAPAGVSSADAKVDTYLVHVGASARPWPKVALSGSVRWEDRDDRAPIAAYNVVGTTAYTNRHIDHEKGRAKAQASYQFTPEMRGALGAEYEKIDRGVLTATSIVTGLSAMRQETDETTVRAELHRRLAETVNGSLIVWHSERDGSNWLRPQGTGGVAEVTEAALASDPTAILMPTLADRQRDSGKLLLDWQATDELALQLSVQSGRDRYQTLNGYGLRSTGMEAAGIDATYMMSDKWAFNAHAWHARERLHQARPAGYILSYDNATSSVGAGVTATPVSRLRVSAGVTYSHDRSEYAQTLDPLATGDLVALLAATGGLPDIVFRQLHWKLDAAYELTKASEVRLALVHQRSRWQDWGWGWNSVPFTFSDGSTLVQQPRQDVTFAGVTYVYRWR